MSPPQDTHNACLTLRFDKNSRQHLLPPSPYQVSNKIEWNTAGRAARDRFSVHCAKKKSYATWGGPKPSRQQAWHPAQLSPRLTGTPTGHGWPRRRKGGLISKRNSYLSQYLLFCVICPTFSEKHISHMKRKVKHSLK